MIRMTKRKFLTLLGLGGSSVLSTSVLPERVLADEGPPGRARLLQGPMAGPVSPTSLAVWLRASDRFRVSLEWSRSADFADARRTAAIRPTADSHFTATLRIEDLQPATTYYYRVLLDDEPDSYLGDGAPYSLRTAPLPHDVERFTVGFGSCARYARDPLQPIWNAVARHDPDFFCWLGDNIYGDSGSVQTLADEYKRQRGVATYRSIAARIPQLAIWDDHDYAFNDTDRTNPVKEEALGLFRDFWANPSHGLDNVPGVFFDYSYGGVDFFLIDVRYYRDPNDVPDEPGKTMLGADQKAWLKERLKASSAPFKVIMSGSGWSSAKGFGGDSWASFIAERNELFRYIRDEGIEGVVLVSGDTHVAELNAIPWSEEGGYDFYDLVSSPLAQPTSDSWLERYPERRIRQPFFGTSNFGLLTFEMQPEPVLTYNAINTGGNGAWEPFRVRAAELRNDVSSWYGKMDETSRERYERARQGGAYFQ